MSDVIAYVNPQRVDKDREDIRQQCVEQGLRVLAEHVGGWGLAQIEASHLGTKIITAEGLVAAPAPAATGKKEQAAARHAHLADKFREAALLGYTSQNAIARYFTEQQVPMASGKVGTWSPIQIRRARKWMASL